MTVVIVNNDPINLQHYAQNLFFKSRRYYLTSAAPSRYISRNRASRDGMSPRCLTLNYLEPHVCDLISAAVEQWFLFFQRRILRLAHSSTAIPGGFHPINRLKQGPVSAELTMRSFVWSGVQKYNMFHQILILRAVSLVFSPLYLILFPNLSNSFASADPTGM